MNPDEAVKAFGLLEARHALAIHHGCFPLADEGIDEPVQALREALIRYGVPAERFVAAAPGAPWALAALDTLEGVERGVEERRGELVSSSALARDSC
jgi:L-ascorbate metabolism protein UlaG (beta-lactamase superfamily)